MPIVFFFFLKQSSPASAGLPCSFRRPILGFLSTTAIQTARDKSGERQPVPATMTNPS